MNNLTHLVSHDDRRTIEFDSSAVEGDTGIFRPVSPKVSRRLKGRYVCSLDPVLAVEEQTPITDGLGVLLVVSAALGSLL